MAPTSLPCRGCTRRPRHAAGDGGFPVPPFSTKHAEFSRGLTSAYRGIDSKTLGAFSRPCGAPPLRCGVQSHFARLSNRGVLIGDPSPPYMTKPAVPSLDLTSGYRGIDSKTLGAFSRPCGAPSLRCRVQSRFARLSNRGVLIGDPSPPYTTKPAVPSLDLTSDYRGIDSKTLRRFLAPAGRLRCATASNLAARDCRT